MIMISLIFRDSKSMLSFSLTLIYSNPYKVFDAQTSGMFDIEYMFNFCDNLPKKCNGVEASAIEFLDIYDTETDTCEVLGMGT